MFGHLPSHVVTEYFAVHTQGLGAYTAVELEILFFVFFAFAKNFGFFRDGDALMLTGQFGAVVVHIALGTEVCLFSDTIKFGQFGRDFVAVLAVRGFSDELFMCVNGEIDQVHR